MVICILSKRKTSSEKLSDLQDYAANKWHLLIPNKILSLPMRMTKFLNNEKELKLVLKNLQDICESMLK